MNTFYNSGIRTLSDYHLEAMKLYLKDKDIILSIDKNMIQIEPDGTINNNDYVLDKILTHKDNTDNPFPSEFNNKSILVFKNNNFICLCSIQNNIALKIYQKYKIKKEIYSFDNIYKNSGIRRHLKLFATSEQTYKSVHDIYIKINSNYLIKELKKIKPGKEDFHKYERIIKDILDAFFDTYCLDGELQKKISGGSFRVDIHYHIPPIFEPRFWDEIFKPSPSLFVECKNSIESKELEKAISQIQKYSNKDIHGIIAIRNKDKLHKMKHYSSIIREKNNFILVLDDNDFEKLLKNKESATIIDIDNQKETVIKTPLSELYKLIFDAKLKYS